MKTIEDINKEVKAFIDSFSPGDQVIVVNNKVIHNPKYFVYYKAAWRLQEIWGLANGETISLSKAREMTTVVIDDIIKQRSKALWE